MSYILGNATLPRPISFTRENLYIQKTFLSVNGRSGTDVTSMKEKFILAWDKMSKDEFDDLFTEIERNIALDFSITDGDFSVEQTSVIPVVRTIEYIMLGSDYIVAMELELIEVT